MTDVIKLLPDHVANQIAAGEVVQRPASVVKELLENAIDAKATEITLVIKDAGKTLIQVIDDGIGMSSTDARLSLERHATSKISKAEDLFALSTKGFRGEALASIAAIAHLEVQTRTDELEIGTKIQVEGSEVKSQESVVTPKGTIIRVRNLFYNIPARRNFLKSDAVERRHIIDEFQRVALAHPDIAFTFLDNDTTIFSLPKSKLRQRIVNVFGNKLKERLVPVTEETDIVRVSGFVQKPEFARKSRNEQFFFVNDRYIRSSYLHHAIVAAFEGLLRTDTQPGYFLFLSIDPKSIDINIHPTKTEIKFDDEHAIYTLLRATIKHSLGQFSITPAMDFSLDSEMTTPYDYDKKKPTPPTIEVDRDFNPFKEEAKRMQQHRSQGGFVPKREAPWEALYTGLEKETTFESSKFSNTHSSEQKRTIEGLQDVEFEVDHVIGTLFEDVHSKPSSNAFQLQKKYIVTSIKSGVVIIHQHLAHQRVLYESLLRNISVKEAVSQQLLFPLSLSFSAQDIALLSNLRDQLKATGFVIEKLEQETMEISGIPVHINESSVQEIMERLLDDMKQDVPGQSFSQFDVLAKSLAKTMAIKVGATLTEEEQEHLINQLFACKEPTLSPTNRRLLITLDIDYLDNKFI